MAPEVFQHHYGLQSDLWSLGVLLYTLVCGYLPFQADSEAVLQRKVLKGDYHFNHDEFGAISEECKDLISKMLVVDPKKRITGQQALHHPWFQLHANATGESESTVRISRNVLNRLRSFKGESTFKQAAMNLLVKTATEQEVRALKITF